MENVKIAGVFDELADLLEFRGENPFRIRAYRAGAKAIRDLDESAAAVLQDPKRELAEIPGIGKTLVDKTRTLVETGTLPQLEKLRRETPEVVIQMARVPGLGAKKAAKIYDALAVQNLDDLRSACESGKVSALSGFGAKTEQAILEGLSIAEQAAQRIYWAKADEIAGMIRRHMEASPAVVRMQWAGSYRRGRETAGDLDLVGVASDRGAAMDHFEAFPGREQTLLRGETKVSIRIAGAFQVDFRLVEANEFGAALQYFTGSQAHNVRVRKIAKSRGLKINEYGVFRVDDAERVAGDSEEDVYRTIGLPWIPPELREDRNEFDWAESDTIPDLIGVDDLIGDLHMHTSATDGTGTIGDMAEAAIRRGLRYIAITDHSKRVAMAGGLDEKRLHQQWEMIDQIRPEYEGRLLILKGIECDILEAGGMDLSDDTLAEADWVLASVHYGQKQPAAQITDRILGAIENPHVSCIAHPTGRLINRRNPYAVDLEAVMKAAREHNTLLELNANPARLDLSEIHVAAAKRMGIPIVINTDAHTTGGLDVMRYGVMQARRGGLTRHDVANTRPWAELRRELSAPR